MSNTELQDYTNRWNDRVRKTRKQFLFEWLTLTTGAKSLKELLKHTQQDIQYLYESLYHTLKHFKHYSSIVKDQYKVSYLRQLFQINYLVFKLRQHPKTYRRYHLFKPEVWQYANQFTYSHYQIQKAVAKKLYPDELKILLNKLKFNKFCKSNNLNTPEVLGYCCGKNFISVNDDFKLPEQDIFVKEIAGQMGAGAKKLNYVNGNYRDLNGNNYSKEDFLNYIREYSNKNSGLMIQPVIQNHELWRKFTSGALATCRAVTAKNPAVNSPELLFASLRMPAGNTDVDNYSRGGIVSAVEIESGVLGKAFCSVPIAGRFEFDNHPDTGQVITGSTVPGWDELASFILTLHKKLRSPFIGWDVALTTYGCMVIEGSLYWNPGASFEASHHQPFSQSRYPVFFESWLGTKLDQEECNSGFIN